MAKEPRVCIIIVNWNGLADTIECMNSLYKIDYGNFEIIIIDNASENNEPNKLRSEFKDVTIVELHRNLGFANANNIGILMGIQRNAEYVLLLNNDTIVDELFLKELVLAGESNPNIGIIGPTMYYYDKRSKVWFSGGKINLYTRHVQQIKNLTLVNGRQNRPTDYIAGACMLVKKEVFAKIGFLPREYFLGWEDIDFCISAKRSGYQVIFVPSSYIWHKVSRSYKRKNLAYRQVFFGFRNRVILRFKYLRGFRFYFFLILQMLGIVPIHMAYYLLVYRDPSRIKQIFAGLKAGLRDKGSRKCVFSLDYK